MPNCGSQPSKALRNRLSQSTCRQLAFAPIQFGMRNLPLPSVDILIVWGTIIWVAVAIWKHYRWVAVAQVPYFIWVSIASVLQLSITASNWGR